MWPLLFFIMFTNAVKALDKNLTLEVLGLPFGEDRQGQVFDANTNIGLQPGDAVPAFFWHGYAERNAGAVKSIGRAIYDRVDAAGHWFKVTLDNASDVALKIYEDAKAGLARASSDSSSHLVRPFGIVGKPGKVTNWPIFAMSLMDSTTSASAVNPRAIAVAAAKALIDESDFEESVEQAGEAAKAGQVFAMRNRERIKALRMLLDEMEQEFPEDERSAAPANADTAAKGNQHMETNIQTPAPDIAPVVAVAVEPKEPQAPSVDLSAVKAEWMKEVEAKLAEQNRLKFASVNVNTGAAVKAEDAAKAYEVAFDRYVRTGDASGFQNDAVKAVMNRTTAGQGGYLPPIKYSNDIVLALNEASKLRKAGARIISVEGSASFKVPTLVNSATAILQTESTSYEEVEPTIGEVTFTPYNRLSLATDELLEDSRIDVFGQILTPDALNAFAQAENTAFTVGTGSSQPQGIMAGGSVGVTAAGTNAITAEEVIDLYHSLTSEYRSTATWVMKDSTLKAIRKMRESGSTTGAFLWQPAISAGEPETIMGRPVVTVSTVEALATGKKVIAFGDLSYFWIADFAYGQAGFKRLDERYAELGQVGFRWSKRFDSHVMLSAAIKTLITA